MMVLKPMYWLPNRLKTKFNRINFSSLWPSILIVLLLLAILRPLLANGYFSSDDYEHHLARLANYYLALKQNQMPPRWAPNLNEGYGYPVFNFIYHAPYAAGSFLHAIGLNLTQSMNISILIILVCSSIVIYHAGIRKKFGQPLSISLALISIFNPYTMLMIFWRGAWGEIFAYSLSLITFVVLDHTIVSKTNRIRQMIIIVMSSVVILSQLPVGLLMLLIAYAHVAIRATRRQLYELIACGLLALLLTCWNWLPMILQKDLIALDQATNSAMYEEQFISLPDSVSLLRTMESSNYFRGVLQLGLLPFLALIVALLPIKHVRINKLHIASVFILGFLWYLLLEPASWVWDSLPLLRFLQFPWRLIAHINFISLLLLFSIGGILQRKLKAILVIGLLASIGFTYFGYAYPRSLHTKADFEWFEWTGSASSFNEHRPIWFTKTYALEEHVTFTPKLVKVRDNTPDLVSITYSVANGSQLAYTLAVPENGFLIHKRAFFPGWKATLDGNDVQLKLYPGDYNGLIVIPVTAGNHEINLRYNNSASAQRASQMISAGTFLSLIIGVISSKRKSVGICLHK